MAGESFFFFLNHRNLWNVVLLIVLMVGVSPYGNGFIMKVL